MARGQRCSLTPQIWCVWPPTRKYALRKSRRTAIRSKFPMEPSRSECCAMKTPMSRSVPPAFLCGQSHRESTAFRWARMELQKSPSEPARRISIPPGAVSGFAPAARCWREGILRTPSFNMWVLFEMTSGITGTTGAIANWKSPAAITT